MIGKKYQTIIIKQKVLTRSFTTSNIMKIKHEENGLCGEKGLCLNFACCVHVSLNCRVQGRRFFHYFCFYTLHVFRKHNIKIQKWYHHFSYSERNNFGTPLFLSRILFLLFQSSFIYTHNAIQILDTVVLFLPKSSLKNIQPKQIHNCKDVLVKSKQIFDREISKYHSVNISTKK